MRHNPTHSAKQVAPGVAVVKTSTLGGMRQIRCPHCHGMASPAQRPDGTPCYRCPAGHEFISKMM